MGIYLPGTENLGCIVWPGAGIAHSQGIPPDFYPPHMNVGPPGPVQLPPPPLCTTLCLLASLLLLPIWMNVAPLHLWLLDFHTVLFFSKVLGVIGFEI